MKKNVYIKILAGISIVFIISPNIIPAMKLVSNEENIVDDQINNVSKADSFFDLKVRILMKIAHLPSLSIGIIKENEIVWYKGYGQYNGYNTPNKDTIYLIGSTTKSITATAVMQLSEKKLFDLDDDVNDYLDFKVENPKYPNINITFRMLLAHQSSLAHLKDTLNNFWEQDTDFSNISIEKYVKEKLLGEEKDKYWGDYKPGNKYVYSNFGYALLGYLVECIAKKPFYQYCKEDIFEPLEMYNTSFNVSELNSDNLATPYIWYNFGFWIYKGWLAQPHYTDDFYPAGYLRSSVEDLSHFLIAHMNGGIYNQTKILNQSTVEEMHTIQYPESSSGILGFKYGIGWCIWERFGKTIKIGHGGDVIGCHSNMWIRKKDNIGVIYFTNIQLNRDIRGFFVRQLLEPIIFKKADKL